jgi:hypothetical protein
MPVGPSFAAASKKTKQQRQFEAQQTEFPSQRFDHRAQLE